MLEANADDGAAAETNPISKSVLDYQSNQAKEHHRSCDSQIQLALTQPINLDISKNFNHPKIPLDTGCCPLFQLFKYQILSAVSARCFRFSTHSNKVRETKTAVNILETRPMTNVTAKPFTGPVPNRNRQTAEISAAKWVSTRVMKTLLKLVTTADTAVLPARSSSRMRSKMRTLESIPTPMVRMTPAIPGNVSAAPKYAKAPKRIIRFKIIAIVAFTPDNL